MSILTDGGGHAKVNILAVREKPHGYDGIDVIRALGGITIMPARHMKLGGEKEACAALCVDESDSDASFDNNERIWTAG